MTLQGRFYDLSFVDEELKVQRCWVVQSSSCYKEIAEPGWGPRSIIIKARAYITHTVCWAAGFSELFI